MRPDDVLAFTRQQPFVPFRLFTTEGRSYDVRHPDQIIVMKSRIIVGVGADGSLPDHAEHIALLHIVRLEHLEAPQSGPRSNGDE